MGVHVVLYQPEIPANTGNIARTCAATGTELHLIRPLGFSTDDKMLKRAGLDYWQHVKITYYDSIEEFYEKNKDGEFFYLTKYGEKLIQRLTIASVRRITILYLEEKQTAYQLM